MVGMMCLSSPARGWLSNPHARDVAVDDSILLPGHAVSAKGQQLQVNSHRRSIRLGN